MSEVGFVEIDNGRLRMRDLDGVLYCEAYMSDEFSRADVKSMVDVIRAHYHGKADIILKKDASYSVSVEAQVFLSKGVPEFGNFVYLVNNDLRRGSAEYAAETYMKRYNAQVTDRLEHARQLLAQLR